MNENQIHSWLNGLAKQLYGGEKLEVTASGTTRSLTVTGTKYMEREPYRCNGWQIKMKGFGTEYELEIPEGGDRPPVLLYPSSSATGEIVKSVDVIGNGPTIVAEQTAEDLGITPR